MFFREGRDVGDDVGELFFGLGSEGHFLHFVTGFVVGVVTTAAVEKFGNLSTDVPVGEGGDGGAFEGEFAVAVVTMAFHAEVAEGFLAGIRIALDRAYWRDERKRREFGESFFDLLFTEF